MPVCGAGNPDHPDASYVCEYPVGHDRIWRYGAWQDHGAPSTQTWWVVAPYTEDEQAAVAFVIGRAKDNPQVETLLLSELAALGWALERTMPRPGGVPTDPFTPRFDGGDPDDADTAEFALNYGAHAPAVPDRPEYRAAGYSVIEPRKL